MTDAWPGGFRAAVLFLLPVQGEHPDPAESLGEPSQGFEKCLHRLRFQHIILLSRYGVAVSGSVDQRGLPVPGVD